MLKKNIIANYFGQFYIIIIGIVMVPFYLKYLGAEAYGLVGFFALMQSWMMLLDMGISPTLGREVALYGITVNAIGPTPVETDLIKAVPKNKIEELLEKQAIKRFGNFEDIKNVIDFFIDKKSDFVTGQIIYLGGVHN